MKFNVTLDMQNSVARKLNMPTMKRPETANKNITKKPLTLSQQKQIKIQFSPKKTTL
jgi:hypothetical protein